MIAQKNANSLSVSELARRAGVSPDTLRHYEAKGVVQHPPRQANGYRSYPIETLERVQVVRRALTIGFTLDELAEIMCLRERGGVPCRKVRDLAAAKLAVIEARLQELGALRDELRATLKDWDARLSKARSHQRSHLLDQMRISETGRPAGRAPFRTTASNKSKGKKQ